MSANFSFIEEATSAPRNSTYDYIIVGGGTAGCAVGATLSSKANVLVLERGGSPYSNTTKIRKESFISTLTDTSPDSFSQAFISEDGVPNNRARVLGGGTAINVGFYSRAEPLFIRQLGLDEALVEDSYKWVERKLVYRPNLLQWQSAVRNGLLEAGVLPYNGFTYHHINGTEIGGTILDRNGNRHTAADLLDGIGPTSQLEPLGIEVVLNQTMVGQGMGDPPSNGLLIPSPLPIELTLATTVGITKFGSYIESACGYDFAALYGSASQTQTQTLPNDLTAAFNKTGESSMANPITNLGNILETIRGPISKGYLELRNTNASDNPKVTFNYFQAPEDLRRCVQGMETLINVVNSKSFSPFRYRNTTTQDLLNMVLNQRLNHRNSTVTSLEQFCRDTVNTLWHYHGGCLVGNVVDRDYKVFGVESLRVIDASTFSFSPGTNPQATVMMLGRYMAIRILESRRR
ncbi:hypothetical protein COLO4_38020 [Corchorus olitorius]|uniref:Glucose-methanol-choline oxidoreductase C-terminal domain-containing protein n=1 Tax=Corchorus olitorius TaxID=93759 RepID=A0A1R3FXG8_9ROSI|nr:hypothetical protein COLO4_38020 [Corchorus olitorius]